MPKTIVLKDNKDFVRAFRNGKCFVTPAFALYVRKNRVKRNRVGYSVSKKIGNAVARNRAKRVLRQSFWSNEKHLPNIGLDFVFVARFRATKLKSFEIEKFFNDLIEKDLKQILSENKK